MAGCLFCSIVAGDVGSTEVLSTDLTYAFRDINPGAPSHVLVVPREHITDAAALDPSHAATLSAVFATANQVAELEGLAEADIASSSTSEKTRATASPIFTCTCSEGGAWRGRPAEVSDG